jgi:tetratricopeptide (TPR) repeat protein
VSVLLAIGLCAGFTALQRSTWHKNRLYTKLLSGDPEQQLTSATTLVYLRAQEQLLAAMQSDNATARAIAQKGLEHLWFVSSGEKAYQLLQKAYKLEEDQKHQEALAVLQEVINKYPNYAEAYNQRASIYWEMGDMKRSMDDSERALMLNPSHYGAWQGLAIGYRQVGNFKAAARCLRMALRFIPQDAATQEALRGCEEAMKRCPLSSDISEPAEIT